MPEATQTPPTPRKRIVEIENEFSQVITSFELFFQDGDIQGGYSFVCDEAGNILFDELPDIAQENARKCLAGEMPGYSKTGEIRKWVNRVRTCYCGSGLTPYDLSDARGIYVAKVCPDCEETTKSKYRKDIFEDFNYHADEPIEADY